MASSFSFGRANPSLNFLPPLFLHLILTLIIQGSTSHQKTSSHSFSLMFMLLLFAPPRRIAELPLYSFLLQKSLHSEGTSTVIASSGTQKVLLATVRRKYSIRSSPLTYFFSITLTRQCSLSLLWQSLISWHLICSLFSCSWEVLQNLGSDYLSILLTVPLSPLFRPNVRPPSFNLQKVRQHGFAFYFDFHCSSAEE